MDGSGAGTRAWSPLLAPVFRNLWIAGLVSNLGAWMHQVGEAWLMTSLTSSPTLVALLEAADSLAIFLLVIPAGALGDIFDRRQLSIATQVWLLIGASLLALLSWNGDIVPWGLIALTFFMGIGGAMDGPVWQALVPEVIPPRELAAALTLEGVSFNLARAAGPAIGGLVVAAAGPAAVFLLNAVSFLCVIVVLARWRRPVIKIAVAKESWLGAVQAGIRYVRHSPELLVIFLRCAVTLLPASCLMALLPLFARQQLALGSAGFGVLLGCMGVGAVVAAFLLPKWRAGLGPETVLALGTAAFGAAVVGLAVARDPWLPYAAMLLAGIAWMAIMSTLNVAVQAATPSWVRARVQSVYMLVFQGAIALGSVLWGTLAAHSSLRTALIAGAVLLGASLVARLRFRLATGTPDLSPSLHWPKPVLLCEPDADSGPVLILIEYRVALENLAGFVLAANAVRAERRRDGAYEWRLFRDPSSPERLIEAFLLDSWAEHLRQHQRVTTADRDAEVRLRALLQPGTEPIITHLVAATAANSLPGSVAEIR